MTGGELGRFWKSFGGDRGGEYGERDAAGAKNRGGPKGGGKLGVFGGFRTGGGGKK